MRIKLFLIPLVITSLLLIIATEKRYPAFTAGGNKDAEIATPTMEEVFSPNTDKAAAAPDAIAINMSNAISFVPPLCAICFVIYIPVSFLCIDSIPMKSNPQRSPVRIQSIRDTNPFLIPLFLSFLSEITQPNSIAKIGPIIGDTSIEATITTELSESKPNRAIKLAKIK